MTQEVMSPPAFPCLIDSILTLYYELMVGGSNTRDRVEKFPASDGQIACHFTHLLEGRDIEKKSKSYVYSVYYHGHRKMGIEKRGRIPRGGDIRSKLIFQKSPLLFQDFNHFDATEKPFLLDLFQDAFKFPGFIHLFSGRGPSRQPCG
jgi:hypothetical protein